MRPSHGGHVHATEGTISRFTEETNSAFCSAKVLSRPCLNWVMSARGDPTESAALCPLRSDSDRFGCTAANAPLCQKGRYAVQQIASASVAILRLISSG